MIWVLTFILAAICAALIARWSMRVQARQLVAHAKRMKQMNSAHDETVRRIYEEAGR